MPGKRATTNATAIVFMSSTFTTSALREPQFRSLIWPLLSRTSVTALPFFTALAVMPSAVDLTSLTCE